MSANPSNGIVTWEAAGRAAFAVLDRYYANDDNVPDMTPDATLTEVWDLLRAAWESQRDNDFRPVGATEGIDYDNDEQQTAREKD